MALGRIERCFTDNIYLIESIPPQNNHPYERNFVIMGNSGNVYQVTIANYPKCTCPDYARRSNRCKHIYFVLMRIMNISNYNDYDYTNEELTQMFLNIPPIAQNLVYKGENPQEQKVVNQKFDKDDVCPICLDPLENGKELDYCKYSCGQTIHKKCFKMWEKSKGAICVFCRAKWYNDIYGVKPKEVSMHPIIRNQEEKKENSEEKKEENKNEDIQEVKNEEKKEETQEDKKEENKDNNKEDNKENKKEDNKQDNIESNNNKIKEKRVNKKDKKKNKKSDRSDKKNNKKNKKKKLIKKGRSRSRSRSRSKSREFKNKRK